MVLSWLARTRRSESVDDLVARRQYVKAAEVLREDFGGRQPTPAERLRMADLLVLAGHGADAMPILLGIADEQARFGFTEKALEALRRASEVEPGRPDVGRRIQELREAGTRPRTAGSKKSPKNRPGTPAAAPAADEAARRAPAFGAPPQGIDTPDLPVLALDELEPLAVRSLPPEAADPDRAAAAPQAHFGSSDWSPRVRTYLARLMLDAGRQDDALAILASVAHDLARRGRAQKAITLLKTVETIRKRGVEAIELAPPRPGRRRSARHAGPSGSSAPTTRAAKEAAFREWVGLLIRATDELAARSPLHAPAEEHDPTDPDLTQISAHATIQRTRKELARRGQVPEHVR